MSDLVDGSPSVSNDAPAAFVLGTTVVTWTATDAAGNSATATQNVSVVDTTPPSLTPPPDIDVVATGPLTAIDIGMAEASDLFDIQSLTNDAPALFPLGITEVTWTAVDNNGNTSTAIQRVTSGYGFSGWTKPVVDGGTENLGRKLPIEIRPTLRDGTLVSGLAPTISVYRVENGDLIGPLEVDAVGPAAGTDVFVEFKKFYKYIWDTGQLDGPGLYRVFVDLGDGTPPESFDMTLL